DRVREHGRVGDRAGIVATGWETAEILPRLAATIRRLVHHLVGALAQVDRLQDVEVEGVPDGTVRVPLREPDVHDHGVLRVVGIHLAERLAGNLFVLPDAGPREAAKRWRLGCGDL